MKLVSVAHQETYSRGELIMRVLFGWLYIAVPHSFVLFFVGLWSAVLQVLSFWVILFTGKYPESWFRYQVKLIKWSTRLTASLSNMIDGYPEIGLNKENDKVSVDIPYPENISRGSVFVRGLFGFLYVGIPHSICLWFRYIAQSFVNFIAALSILFTGQYPENMFVFSEGTIRWQMAVGTYLSYMTQTYPKFNGTQE